MRNTNGCVYVVDDDVSIREALSGLARSRGLRVKTFENARAFFDHPRAQGPSCLVLDIQLPGLSGPELHALLTRTRERIPVIYVTGHGDVATAVEAMKSGAAEFLSKPFDPQALLDAIQRCLERWSLERSDDGQARSSMQCVEFESFRLDAQEQCLWRLGGAREERMLLSPKAFTVLRYLVERPGRLVTEEELLRAGWPKVCVQPEAVKHRLYEIRKALGDNPKVPRFIETRHRCGYRFIAPLKHAETAGQAIRAPASTGHGLAGRAPALSALQERLQCALRGERQVIFIQGDLGIGKTALVDEFQRLAAAESRGLRIGCGHCIDAPGAVESYYPVLEALESLWRQSSEIVETLGVHAPTWLVQFPALLTDDRRRTLQQEILGVTRKRMLRELAQALETYSAVQPLLLVLEDLQWADTPTLNLISAVAHRRTAARVMLIGTLRPFEASESAHALQLLTSDLSARGLSHMVELEPLTSDDISGYLANEWRGEVQRGPIARSIQRMTGGNPLFLQALLEHMRELGVAQRTDCGWELKALLPEESSMVPRTIEVLIQSQLLRLRSGARRALEAASLAGSAFTAAEVARAAGEDADELEPVLEALATQKRILRHALAQIAASEQSCYEFVNPFYRRVLSGQPRRYARIRSAVATSASAALC